MVGSPSQASKTKTALGLLLPFEPGRSPIGDEASSGDSFVGNGGGKVRASMCHASTIVSRPRQHGAGEAAENKGRSGSPLAGRPGPDHGPSMRARTGRPSPPPPPPHTPPSPSPFIIHGPSSIRQAPSAAFVNRHRRALLSPGKRDSMRSRVFVSMDRYGTHQARGKKAHSNTLYPAGTSGPLTS